MKRPFESVTNEEKSVDPSVSSSALTTRDPITPAIAEEFSGIEQFRRGKTAVIAVVALALFTDMVLYDMIVPILPTLLRKVGRDESYVGILFAIYAVGFLLATPLFGIWSDRTRTRKLPMILGQAGLALATVLFALANSFWLLVVARLLQGVAAAVSWTLGLALLADAVPEAEHGQAMGIVFGFNTLGYFVGPLIGGILTQVVSIQTPFIIGSILCVIDLIARALIRPPPPAEVRPNKRVTIPRLLRCPEVPLIGLVVTCTSISFSAVETLLSSYLQRRFGQDVMRVSFSMMAIIIPSVVFSFLAGWWSDRVCRYRLILLASCLYLPATPLLGAAPNLVLFLLASVYFGATSSILQAPTLPEMGAIVGRMGGGSYAQVYGILNICYSMGMLVGPLVASLVNDRWGFLVTMSVVALPFILIIPTFTILSIQSSRGTLGSCKVEDASGGCPEGDRPREDSFTVEKKDAALFSNISNTTDNNV